MPYVLYDFCSLTTMLWDSPNVDASSWKFFPLIDSTLIYESILIYLCFLLWMVTCTVSIFGYC